jgi:hypothetical protein
MHTHTHLTPPRSTPSTTQDPADTILAAYRAAEGLQQQQQELNQQQWGSPMLSTSRGSVSGLARTPSTGLNNTSLGLDMTAPVDI